MDPTLTTKRLRRLHTFEMTLAELEAFDAHHGIVISASVRDFRRLRRAMHDEGAAFVRARMTAEYGEPAPFPYEMRALA